MEISKLIAKLKRERPELEDEPLLDEIEAAAGGEEEMSEEELPADEADAMNFEEEMSSEDEAEDEEEYAPKSKKKFPF